MLTVIDEYFPLACPLMTTSLVIKCLTQIFTVFGTPFYMKSERNSSFLAKELSENFTNLDIATSQTTHYNPPEE